MKHLGKLNLENEEELKRRIGRGKILTHISLFAGCGGLDIGFSNAGIQTRLMIEWDKSCCETLRHNFHWEELKNRTFNEKIIWKTKEAMKKDITWYHDIEPVIIQRDIKDVSSEEILRESGLQIGECSIVSGGFPCQGFSLVGKRVIDDPRNFLYREFVRIVNDIKPAMIIGENVPGIVSMGKGEVIKQICKDFSECGYDISWNILDACDYGVPQHRKRVILIGKRIDMFRVNEEGKPSYHIGVGKGEVTHPQLFYDRLKRWNRKKKL